MSRPGRPRRGEPTLSRERVVERALELADAEGAAALTMRRLGRELGVEAMALYTHVRSKDDLLSAIGSRILTELEVVPRERPDWRGRIQAVCRAWAALRARHPHCFPLVYAADTGVQPVTEELMDALLTAGFAGADAWLAPCPISQRDRRVPLVPRRKGPINVGERHHKERSKEEYITPADKIPRHNRPGKQWRSFACSPP